jgi:hypothetical protein
MRCVDIEAERPPADEVDPLLVVAGLQVESPDAVSAIAATSCRGLVQDGVV